jgi:hypothetical protein
MPRIPLTASGRRDKTFAQLVLRVKPRATINAFEGRFLRCGAHVNVCDLWPTVDYPNVPLLIEFAGFERGGYGHVRARDIHVLWRYEVQTGKWVEIARILSHGPEWVQHLKPIIEAQFDAPPENYVKDAMDASDRVLALLDNEIEALSDEGRARLLSVLFDQLAARIVEPTA